MESNAWRAYQCEHSGPDARPLSIPVEQQRATGPMFDIAPAPFRREDTGHRPTKNPRWPDPCRGCASRSPPPPAPARPAGRKCRAPGGCGRRWASPVPRSCECWCPTNRSSDEERRAKDRHAIEECHAQAERPTIDPGARGFTVAGACDLMEAQFRPLG